MGVTWRKLYIKNVTFARLSSRLQWTRSPRVGYPRSETDVYRADAEVFTALSSWRIALYLIILIDILKWNNLDTQLQTE